MQHIALSSVNNVHIYNITLLAPSSHASYPSHNTDGIDVNGQNIVIENSNISVGKLDIDLIRKLTDFCMNLGSGNFLKITLQGIIFVGNSKNMFRVETPSRIPKS
jgi:hypothetical protein